VFQLENGIQSQCSLVAVVVSEVEVVSAAAVAVAVEVVGVAETISYGW
jgi:hypothetical protein